MRILDRIKYLTPRRFCWISRCFPLHDWSRRVNRSKVSAERFQSCVLRLKIFPRYTVRFSMKHMISPLRSGLVTNGRSRMFSVSKTVRLRLLWKAFLQFFLVRECKEKMWEKQIFGHNCCCVFKICGIFAYKPTEFFNLE